MFRKKPPHPPNRLRVMRAETRLSQEALARKMRASQTRVCLIENGHQEPTPAELAKLAKIFNRPIQEIFPSVAAYDA